MPWRSFAYPAAIVRTGAPGARPLFASFPSELLTYTIRVSALGV